KEILNRLPREIREQIVQAVKESLALVDVSVNKHMSRVDEILQSNIDRLRCQTTAAGTDFVDGLKKVVNELKPFSTKDVPASLDTTKTDAEALRRQITVRSTSEDIAQLYASILYRIGVAVCQASVDEDSKQIMLRFQAKYSAPARIWLMLFGKCTHILD